MAAEQGKRDTKGKKGERKQLLIRLEPELQSEVAALAKQRHVSVNRLVADTLRAEVEKSSDFQHRNEALRQRLRDLGMLAEWEPFTHDGPHMTREEWIRQNPGAAQFVVDEIIRERDANR